MRLFNAVWRPEGTLKQKLFLYMLLLGALLLLAVLAGLFLSGQLPNTNQETYKTLDVQMEAFEKGVSGYFDRAAASGLHLSETMSKLIGRYLKDRPLADITDRPEAIAQLQQTLLDPLRQALLRSDCSGAFILLDVTINSAVEHAAHSRMGIYLQINGYDANASDVLLYRGIAGVAKEQGIVLHRKWRQEFDTALFPDYEKILAMDAQGLTDSYYFTPLITLPGTSERTMLLVVPILGADGTRLGLCGFEISASYFMTHLAQPTKLSRLTCLIAPETHRINASLGLSCGTSAGYYRAPVGQLKSRAAGGGLMLLRGEARDYVGVRRTISLSPNNAPYCLLVMIPREDYLARVRAVALQNAILWLLVLLFAISCSLFFSRGFLSPILRALEQIKSAERVQSNIPEIDDLFAFLHARDMKHEESLTALEQAADHAQREAERLRREYEQAQQDYVQAQSRYESAREQIARLAPQAYPIDSENYRLFCEGLRDLTRTERKVFDLYFEGKSAKEILEALQIKENTLKYHNKGIYSKLGVSSRKQLLAYMQQMKQQDVAETAHI